MTGLDMNSLSKGFGTQIDKAQGDMSAASAAMAQNPNDAKAMLDLQTASNAQSNLIGLYSTMIKTAGDAIRGIIQKMP
ncbi:MAG: EscF/YscF/HrpA family type III secretion system needle major subunit [Rhodospirillaceae bacterium]